MHLLYNSIPLTYWLGDVKGPLQTVCQGQSVICLEQGWNEALTYVVKVTEGLQLRFGGKHLLYGCQVLQVLAILLINGQQPL